jgi:hypothetical protein
MYYVIQKKWTYIFKTFIWMKYEKIMVVKEVKCLQNIIVEID